MLMNSNYRRVLGNWGERRARTFLESDGMQFIARHFQTRFGELDLIMQDGDTIVFVEVKTRRSKQYGTPEQSITKAKKLRIYKAAVEYLERNNLYDRDWRVDVIAIECRDQDDMQRIDHYVNIEIPTA